MIADLKQDFLTFLTLTIAKLRWEESSPLPISRVSASLIAVLSIVTNCTIKDRALILENRFIDVRWYGRIGGI